MLKKEEMRRTGGPWAEQRRGHSKTEAEKGRRRGRGANRTGGGGGGKQGGAGFGWRPCRAAGTLEEKTLICRGQEKEANKKGC